MKGSQWWLSAVLGAGLLGGLVGSALGRPTFAATPRQSRGSVQTTTTVVGSSTTLVTPTGAQVSVGFQDNGATATQALARNNAVTARIISRLEALKVPAKDLQTNGFNINPNYGNGSSNVITGYQVSNGVNVTLSHLDMVAQVLDAAVAAGANQVNGVTFTGGAHTAYPTAYRNALRDARAQAQAIATSLNEKIAGVASVTVQNAGGVPPEIFGAMNAAVAAVRTPVLAGQQQVTVSLQVVYKLVP